ncbi:RidA family protein [Desulfoluna spongiiphila]|uniref:RidA family protein n=1 Tax=Desulfoluna spongiiphila TaxID=419481 RepID=UPI001255BE97|nr:RidA family protein [Desulfoluna spongiiphila]VVS92283.1 rida family [Desulfoluna spongiiphila]
MKETLFTEKAPAAIGPYSQGIATTGLVFVSGQLPVNPETGAFPEGGVASQTKQSLKNLVEILACKNMTLDHVVKTTVFLSSMDDFSEMNAVYQEMFGEGKYPARSAVEVARLPKDALVEIEAIAAMG